MDLNIIDSFAGIASDERLIRELSEAVKNNLFYEEAGKFFRIQPGIKGGQQVVALDPLEYVTKKDEGCGHTPISYSINGVTQKWNPQFAKVSIKMCYTEFIDGFTRWGLANGYDVHKLDESNFFDYIKDTISNAMMADFTRLAMFSDEDIASQSILGDENKAEFYDIIPKGLVPTLQYFKTLDEFSANFIDISANNETKKADQLTLGSTDALDIFEELTDNQYFDSDQILTSNTLFKNYKNYLRRGSGNTPLESSKDQIMNGMESLKFDGQLLTPMKFYDKKRTEDFVVHYDADEDAGTAAYDSIHLPHLAVNTSKDNLVVGVDDLNSLNDIRLEYIGGSDENFYIKASYQVDFKIPNPSALRAAF